MAELGDGFGGEANEVVRVGKVVNVGRGLIDFLGSESSLPLAMGTESGVWMLKCSVCATRS